VNGTLNCGANNITGSGTFNLASGGTLGIGSSDGIASSGATGNIRTTTRTYDAGGNYNYNGSAAQNTGDGLPTTLNGGLTINNSTGVTLSQNTTVNGALTLTSGNLSLGANDLTIGSSGSISGPIWGSTASSYIVAEGAGELLKATPSSFIFPVGTASA